jgi:hypothetical protein
MISAGGALGGLSVSLIAPQVFNTYAEWMISLVAGFVLAATVAFVLAGSSGTGLPRWGVPRTLRMSLRGALRTAGLVAALLALVEIVLLTRTHGLPNAPNAPVVEQTRNFYGVLSVIDMRAGEPPVFWRELYNGGIVHGLQFADPSAHGIPTTYYSHNSAVGEALKYYQEEASRSDDPLRVGVVGLGVGTLAVYVYLPWHTIRFYEINPEVSRLAETHFTYLANARRRGAAVETVLGDARLSLERELRQGPQAFDLLVLDAFSSDSIPIHLLTREAFEIYLPHLAPEGAIAVHISNRSLDLAPVVYGLAEHFQFDAVRVFSNDAAHGGWMTEWIVLSRNKALLAKLRAIEGDFKSQMPTPPLPLWTDQRHDLLRLLK